MNRNEILTLLSDSYVRRRRTSIVYKGKIRTGVIDRVFLARSGNVVATMKRGDGTFRAYVIDNITSAF